MCITFVSARRCIRVIIGTININSIMVKIAEVLCDIIDKIIAKQKTKLSKREDFVSSANLVEKYIHHMIKLIPAM